MIYLSGKVVHVEHPLLGFMIGPHHWAKLPAGAWWAMDNGCFGNPHAFDWDKFRREVERRLAAAGDKCLFIVAPDIPFDSHGTRQRFDEYESRLASLGAPIAFVTQDGMGTEDIPWGRISTLFIGGSTSWKLGQESTAIMHAAANRGVWVHVGRVNSLRKLQTAAVAGANSADGTFLKYGPLVNWPRLRGWLDTMRLEPPMRVTG